jgi:dCTP deaminase
MILSDHDIKQTLAEGKIIIDPLKESQIGPTSVDLTLGPILLKYKAESIEIGRSRPETTEIEISQEHGYCLQPGEFVLGCTLEWIYIANGYQGFIETKGDIARAGIQVHNCDGHVDPGSNHRITLELSNQNTVPIVLYPNILICQMYIHTLSGACDQVYRGKYHGQDKPTTYKIS